MMLTSSMEASQTLAYYVGGSNVDNFVNLMNQKADELGLENTHFTNPTGLYDSNQYTTARDMATLHSMPLMFRYLNRLQPHTNINPLFLIRQIMRISTNGLGNIQMK